MARTRDKVQMAADAAIAMSSGLSDDAKRAVLRNVIWHWTLHGLTYKRNCPLVSKKVLRLTKRADWASKVVRKLWTFEHAVPIIVLVEEMFKYKRKAKHKEILDKYAVACLITKDEDQCIRRRGLRARMPDDWKWGDDAFARYNRAGIEIVIRVGSSSERVNQYIAAKNVVVIPCFSWAR